MNLMQPIIMPRLDEAQKAGMVIEWLKKESEQTTKDEIVAKIMTEKVTFEMPAPTSGTIKIFAKENVTIPVGQTIAVIIEPQDTMGVVNNFIREVEESLVKLGVKRMEKIEKAEVELKKVKISPLAKKIAEEHHLDTGKIKGTGPRGRIVKKDVLKAIEEAKVSVPKEVLVEKVRTIPLTGITKIMAERMTQSHTTIPHVTLTMEINTSEIFRLREAYEKLNKEELSFNTVFIASVAKALQKYPLLNSTLVGEEIKVFEEVNIGLAVATEQGLIVPVARDADKKSLTEVNKLVKDLIEKARQDKLSIKEVTGGTFTITNLGMYGIDTFTPMIYPGQAAILGIGRILEKPVVQNGRVDVKRLATLSLTFDHRIVDGALGARFLSFLKSLLENPYEVLL